MQEGVGALRSLGHVSFSRVSLQLSQLLAILSSFIYYPVLPSEKRSGLPEKNDVKAVLDDILEKFRIFSA